VRKKPEVEAARAEDVKATALDARAAVRDAEPCVAAASGSVPAGAWSKEQRSHRRSRLLDAQAHRNAAWARSATLALPERRHVVLERRQAVPPCGDAARHARRRRAVGRSPSPPNILPCEINNLQR
jgi:hypothetical protein